MKKIGVVTSTRAEYGLLKNIMKEIENSGKVSLCLFVTGTHLMEDYGNTVTEIEKDGFAITKKIPMIQEKDTNVAVPVCMGHLTIDFAKAFEEEKPDLLMVLGDRYELLPICNAALMMRIPIAHICGGEITQGAIDDCIRHAVTKMSNLHFTSCEAYRNRVIQLGELPETVFNYGDVGVENIKRTSLIPQKELEDILGYSLNNCIAMTFHPLTTKPQEVRGQIHEVLSAVEEFPDMEFVITKSNADAGGELINQTLEEFVKEHHNCHLHASLGITRYLSLIQCAKAVIGNSSSGIIEAPVLQTPTVDIGDRQKGRIFADSIIHCGVHKKEIVDAILYAISKEGQVRAANVKSAFEGDHTSKRIVEEVIRYMESPNYNTAKVFYDCK